MSNYLAINKAANAMENVIEKGANGRLGQNLVKRSALTTANNVQNLKPTGNKVNLRAPKGKVEKLTRVGTRGNPAPKSAVNNENECNETVVKNLKKTATVSKIPRLNEPKLHPTEQFNLFKEAYGFSSLLLPENVEDIDKSDTDNVLLAPEYVQEIYVYLTFLENKQSVKANFLAVQKEMSPRMRSVLIDWIINVHHQFKLLPETLYMSVSIMDRFFQREQISKDKIQLVGVTALFIASKFEEIYPPDVKDFVIICDELYHKRDIIKMEMSILKVLKFELGRPLPLHFLRRDSKAAHADSKIHTVAKYLMELTLVEYECSSWHPSLLAATSLYVTLRLLSNNKTIWSPTLEYYCKYPEEKLLPYASVLCRIIKNAEKSKFQYCRKKYSSVKFMEISKIKELSSPKLDELIIPS